MDWYSCTTSVELYGVPYFFYDYKKSIKEETHMNSGCRPMLKWLTSERAQAQTPYDGVSGVCARSLVSHLSRQPVCRDDSCSCVEVRDDFSAFTYSNSNNRYSCMTWIVFPHKEIICQCYQCIEMTGQGQVGVWLPGITACTAVYSIEV